MEFSSAGEHDDRDLRITKNMKLFSFLEDTISPLRVSHLPVGSVFDLLDLDFSTPHVKFLLPLSLDFSLTPLSDYQFRCVHKFKYSTTHYINNRAMNAME